MCSMCYFMWGYFFSNISPLLLASYCEINCKWHFGIKEELIMMIVVMYSLPIVRETIFFYIKETELEIVESL